MEGERGWREGGSDGGGRERVEGGRERVERKGRRGWKEERDRERKKLISILLSIKMISDLSGVKVRPSQHVL